MGHLPVVENGPRVFRIWKNTLLFWLSSRENKVYLVSPFLDQDILKEFLDIVLRKRETANIEFFYVREKCQDDFTFQRIKDNTLGQYSSTDQNFLKETVFLKAHGITPKISYFHAKFIGCENTETGEAEVLLTSANFTKKHFKRYIDGVHTCNNESLSYHQMKKAEFHKKFIQPMKEIYKVNMQ